MAIDLLKRIEPRLPRHRQSRLQLGLRTLYILPTGLGWLWLAGLAMLLLVGVQTQANGPLLLAFLMLGLWLLALHLTHFNLHGLELSSAPPHWGFAGEAVPYTLLLRSAGRCEGLRLQWSEAPAGEPLALEALGPGDHALELAWRPQARGLQRPGRLRLWSTAPLGLFVCWSVWHPPEAQRIVPARVAGPVRELVGAVPLGEEGAPRGAGGGRRCLAGSAAPAPPGQPQPPGLEAARPGPGGTGEALCRRRPPGAGAGPRALPPPGAGPGAPQ